MRLFDRITLASALLKIAGEQREIIDFLKRERLESRRELLDVTIAFRLHQEQPEVDLREQLDGMILTLRDEVAQLEEHVS